MAAVIQVKRGSASSWTSANTVLAAGEIGFETDTKKMKVGDGSTAWTSLAYTATDGDISGVTAGTGLSGGGNSGAVTLNLSTPVATTNGGTGLSSFTTGDLVYASGSNTLAARSIGSTGQVLTVSDGLPTWAAPAAGGGMTQLASGSFSGSSLALTSISGSYKNLVLQISELSVNSVSSAFALTFMGLSSDYRYATRGTYGTTTNAFTEGNMSSADIPLRFVDNLDTGNNNSLNIIFYDYAASTIKLGEFVGMVDCRFTQPTIAMGAFGNTNASARAALTSITVTVSTTFDGGTYKLFGVN